MNHEITNIALTEFAGIAVLILAALFAGGYDYIQSRFSLAQQRRPSRSARTPRQGDIRAISRKTGSISSEVKIP